MLTKICIKLLKIELLFFKNLFHRYEAYRLVEIVPDNRYKYKYRLDFYINWRQSQVDIFDEVYCGRYNKDDYSKHQYLINNPDILDDRVKKIENKILKIYSENF